MPEVFVSIGSNIDPRSHISKGLAKMESRFGPLRVSPVYESQAVGFKGENFLNLVVGFETDLDAPALNDVLHDIEMECGRRRGGQRYAPRSLDLDLILYGDEVLQENGVHVPREDILRYAFVLRPLAEIAGDRRHPQLGERFSDLWARFDAASQELWPASLDAD